MPEEPQEIRSINWREVFPWTQLFRGFRMAVDPKKLLLATAALLGLFFAGKGLDLIWGRRVPLMSPPNWQDHFNGEGGRLLSAAAGKPASAFEPSPANFGSRGYVDLLNPPPPPPGREAGRTPGLDVYHAEVKKLAEGRIRSAEQLAEGIAEMELRDAVKKRAETKDLSDDAKKAPHSLLGGALSVKPGESVTDKKIKDLVKQNGAGWAFGLAQDRVRSEYDKALEDIKKPIEDAEKAVTTAQEALDKVAPDTARPEGEERDKAFAAAKEAAEKGVKDARRRLRKLQNLQKYELAVGRDRLITVLRLQDGVAISEAFSANIGFYFNQIVDGAWNLRTAQIAYGLKGILLTPVWLVREHAWYALVYVPILLLLAAVFGGAVCRVAAVQFARDEKIGFREALSFGWKKKISFLVSPVIPLLLAGLILLIMALVALAIINIPVLGETAGTVAFFLALLGGFIMALIVIGTVAGAGLMHPTIAVEGSDAFDAISRSFSYIYSRPWSAVFYAFVAVLYGALSYVFVRFFVWLMLTLTHLSVNAGVLATRPADVPADEAAEEGVKLVSKFEAMWSAPTFDELWKSSPHLQIRVEDLGSFFLSVWVGLVLFMLSAFVVSFVLSELTIIYYLLRQQVDATELDDVYIEEPEDEFTPPAPTPTPAPAGPKIDLPQAAAAPPAPPPPAPVAPPPPAPPVETPVAAAPPPPPAPPAAPAWNPEPPAPAAEAPAAPPPGDAPPPPAGTVQV